MTDAVDLIRVGISANDWVALLRGGEEFTDNFRQATVAYAILNGWATTNCASYKPDPTTASSSSFMSFRFADKMDAIKFWQRWQAPTELRKASIFVLDDIDDVGGAVDWLEENVPDGHKFFSPFHGIDSAVIVVDETENREKLTHFALTYAKTK